MRRGTPATSWTRVGSTGDWLELAGCCIRIRSSSSITKSTFPERRSALAAARDGTGTSLTESWFLDPAACTNCSVSGDRAPTTPTVWGVGPPPLWRVGMTIAAPTAIRMMSVPTRKMRPRTRSVISRFAIKPTSPKEPSRAGQLRTRLPVWAMSGPGVLTEPMAPALASARSWAARRLLRRLKIPMRRAMITAATRAMYRNFTPAPPGTPRTDGDARRRTGLPALFASRHGGRRRYRPSSPRPAGRHHRLLRTR